MFDTRDLLGAMLGSGMGGRNPRMGSLGGGGLGGMLGGGMGGLGGGLSGGGMMGGLAGRRMGGGGLQGALLGVLGGIAANALQRRLQGSPSTPAHRGNRPPTSPRRPVRHRVWPGPTRPGGCRRARSQETPPPASSTRAAPASWSG